MALLLSLALSTPVAAQTVPPSDQDAVVPDVVVDGQRLTRREVEAAATEFVDQIAAPPYGAQIARWNTPICVGISNMRAPYGQLIVDQISSHAADLGLDIGEPGCKPNVVIVATRDGRATANHLVDEAELSFRPTDGASKPSREALRAFRTSDAPVRWWNVALPMMADTGDPAYRPRGGMGTGNGPPDAPFVNVYAGSRLSSDVRYDMTYVMVVVDLSRTGSVSMSALADYVSMVALAQIDPNADITGFDSILNVFTDPGQAQDLSSWDRSYLASLYSGQANRFTARQRQGEVVGGLVDQQMTATTPGSQ